MFDLLFQPLYWKISSRKLKKEQILLNLKCWLFPPGLEELSVTCYRKGRGLPPVPCSASVWAARRWPGWRSLRWWRGGSAARSHKRRQRVWSCPPCFLCCHACSRCVRASSGEEERKKKNFLVIHSWSDLGRWEGNSAVFTSKDIKSHLDMSNRHGGVTHH